MSDAFIGRLRKSDYAESVHWPFSLSHCTDRSLLKIFWVLRRIPTVWRVHWTRKKLKLLKLLQRSGTWEAWRPFLQTEELEADCKQQLVRPAREWLKAIDRITRIVINCVLDGCGLVAKLYVLQKRQCREQGKGILQTGIEQYFTSNCALYVFEKSNAVAPITCHWRYQ